MVLEVLVHVERVQELGVEAGEQHVYHDGDVDLLRCGQVRIRPLLVLDAFLHVLVVQVEVVDRVVCTEVLVVIGDYCREGFLLLLRVLPVVLAFLWQIFLDLANELEAQGVSRKVGYRENGAHRFARQGALATMVQLVLRPEDLVRPPYDVEVQGAEAFVDFVQPRAT